jgi:hypothetical protein
MTTNPSSNPTSIYIPQVHCTITEEDLKHIFNELNLGNISRVDLVSKNNNMQMAFVHFEEWYNNDIAKNLLDTINDPTQTATVVYNDPYYWTLLPNTSTFTSNSEGLSENLLNTEQLELQYQMIVSLQERILSLENALKSSMPINPPAPLIRENYINKEQLYYNTPLYSSIATDETQMSPLTLPSNSVLPSVNSSITHEKTGLVPLEHVPFNTTYPLSPPGPSLIRTNSLPTSFNMLLSQTKPNTHGFSDSEDTGSSTSDDSSWADANCT